MILDRIITQKKEEVKLLRNKEFSIGGSIETRGLADALSGIEAISVIAEVKKASPSKGIICSDFKPVAQAIEYEKGGASAVSVLTDEVFFQGSIEYLKEIKKSIALPVLRKDFIIDCLQIKESAAYNADAVLLIAAALEQTQLEELYSCAGEFGLDALIEVHNPMELERVLRLDPEIIGINNRDLNDFSVSLDTTTELIRMVPKGVTVVSESGITDSNQSGRLLSAGVSAVLVGESLMRSPDPGRLIEGLRISMRELD
ncbi:MAG: indole-3-glycerol phosphate synthase TrpC [Chitinivibrionales bacterium]